MAQNSCLIVGASGQVGTQLLSCVAPERALPTSRVPREGWLTLDLSELQEPSQVATVLEADPRTQDLDAIYCVGGMTYVDGCESQPKVAYRTNGLGPGVLASYALRRRIPFVYFSTEYLFDGSKEHPGPYAEDAPANPLSVYGKTKLEGERLVLSAYPEALVLRTTVVYGPDPRRKNYVYTLMKSLAAGTAMVVPMDQISTPTYNRDLIRTMLGLVEAGASGIFHVCGPELMGRLEFARAVASRLGLDTSLLHGVPTAELGQTAARPLAAGLSTEKLQRLFPALHMRTLSEALDDCATEIQLAP